MNHTADKTDNPARNGAVCSLRQLTRDYSDGKLSFSDYRQARARLLDGIASGDLELLPYQPPQPSLIARVSAQANLSDTEPTLRIPRPPSRWRHLWMTLLLVVLLAIAVVAGLYS